MGSIDNRERLVLVATGFNLLFEYSLSGIYGFLLQSLLLRSYSLPMPSASGFVKQV